MPVALVTGGSAGLGRALTRALAADGWRVVVDGRDADPLRAVADDPNIVAVAGDVADDWHRGALGAAVEREGRLDLLVLNASALGPSPLPALATATVEDLQEVWRTNVAASLALSADLLPALAGSRGVLLSISSDAAVEHYPGWGLYGASKAALDHLTLTFGEENPDIAAYAVDPGDMRTQMHQDAFPGEDISDRPLPETVVPHLLALIASRPPSGRYRAAEIAVTPSLQRVGA
ncbi:MAG TPA: SDR family NAD(P)-dependent oxidoreductase [Marmoricola sp.]|nr:SDR family NAD(P)-dependent oxidoreductase [Marmoricola sp.]